MSKIEVRSIAKVDESLGVVYGWGMICTVGGEDYYDAHDEHLPEDVMLKAVVKFMAGEERSMKNMHKGEPVGKVLFGFPMTKDIAKAVLGVELDQSGFIVGMKPENDEILKGFADGILTGFSLGGYATLEEKDELDA